MIPFRGVPSAPQYLQGTLYATFICIVFPIRYHTMFIPTMSRRHVKKRMVINMVGFRREQLSQNVPLYDARDEWLEMALFRQTQNNDVCRRGSIFQTADMVVDHFLSPHENQVVNFPLRRMYTFNQCDKEREEAIKSNELFNILFGPCKNHEDHGRTCSTNTNKKHAQRKRVNLKLTIAYRGVDFCGWEDQRHHLYRKENSDHGAIRGRNHSSNQKNSLPSVQGTLVDILDPILNERALAAPTLADHLSAERTTKPIEIKVAGRTDAGVNAIAQTCRIRTWKNNFSDRQRDQTKPTGELETFVKDLVNEHTKNIGLGLRIASVEKVGDDFHPTFGASCRAYAYLIDLDHDKARVKSQQSQIMRDLIPRLDSMLRSLEGQSLDYIAFSYGKVKTETTICRLVRARAGIVEWNKCDNESSAREAICIELVADRFLRRMVRILVATALREACGIKGDRSIDHKEGQWIGHETSNPLLNIVKMRDRAHCARAAPADGLIFVGAGYQGAKYCNQTNRK